MAFLRVGGKIFDFGYLERCQRIFGRFKPVGANGIVATGRVAGECADVHGEEAKARGGGVGIVELHLTFDFAGDANRSEETVVLIDEYLVNAVTGFAFLGEEDKGDQVGWGRGGRLGCRELRSGVSWLW